MEKFSIQALGRGLKHEFKPPEDLPFPLRKALEALASCPLNRREVLQPTDLPNPQQPVVAP